MEGDQYHGGCSVPWRVLNTAEDISSKMGDIIKNTEYPPKMYHDIFQKTEHEKCWSTERPPQYWWYLSKCIMLSPTVLDIPYGTQGIPQDTQDNPTELKISPHRTEHLPQH